MVGAAAALTLSSAAVTAALPAALYSLEGMLGAAELDNSRAPTESQVGLGEDLVRVLFARAGEGVAAIPAASATAEAAPNGKDAEAGAERADTAEEALTTTFGWGGLLVATIAMVACGMD